MSIMPSPTYSASLLSELARQVDPNMNGHQSDMSSQKIQKFVAEYFTLPPSLYPSQTLE